MKQSAKRLANRIGDKAEIGARVWTRLWQDDEREVAQLSSQDQSQATVIRELVSEALHARHLKQAGRHPAIRALLNTFDELTNASVQQAAGPLNQQLAQMAAQQERTNRFLAALFLTITEKFEFAPDTPNQAADDSLFMACVEAANEMSKIMLAPPPDSAATSTPPAPAQLVAQDLTSEPIP